MAPTIKRITSVGIPVLGHVGLTPQRQHSLGGFRVQGKTAESAARVLDDALAVQEAGCFAIVLEAMPTPVAELITKELKIPTIGIGAGNGCSGQVLVQVDMLGNFPPGRFLPKFVKVKLIVNTLLAYATDGFLRLMRIYSGGRRLLSRPILVPYPLYFMHKRQSH